MIVELVSCTISPGVAVIVDWIVMAVASNVSASIMSVKVKLRMPLCTAKEKLCSSGLVMSGRWIRAWMGPVDSMPFPAVSKTELTAMTK